MDRHEREYLDALTARVALLERQLAALYEHLHLTPASGAPPLDAVAELLRAGNQLEAIELYRQYMDCDLATARAAVEQLGAQLGFA